jgi:hypothetical protein
MMSYIIAALLLVATCVIAFLINKLEAKAPEKISFKETLDLTDLPIITFKQGVNKLNLILDTAANNSLIDSNISDKFVTKETSQKSMMYGVEGNMQEVNFVEMDIYYKDKCYTDNFQVVDMANAFNNIKKESGVTVHGILGNKFLEKYKYVIDFKELVAYTKDGKH